MQFIIDFLDQTSQAEIDSYLAANSCTVTKQFSVQSKCYVVETDTAPSTDVIIETITRDDLNPISLLSTVSFDTAAPAEWWKMASFTRPDFAATTQVYERKGATATVYIVDSGVDSTHPEFIDADVTNLFTFTDNFTDTNGHGTAMASVISGKTCGVTAAKIKSVKIFQSGTSTLQSHLVAAFDAIMSDMLISKSFPIVNLSWSIPKNSYIESKIQLIIDMGAVVVSSAGNSGVPIQDVTPASHPNVITVGAFNQDFLPCNFSNYTGSLSTTPNAVNLGALDIWAPGEDIACAALSGGIYTAAGTSIAAAIQSAALAYNSATFVLSDGSVPPEANTGDGIMHISSGHNGLIVLTDQYVNSVNKSATFRGEINGQNGLVYSSVAVKQIISSRSGTRIAKNFTTDFTTELFEMTSPLPPGISLDNGWIIGTIGTVNDTMSQVYTATANYKNFGSDMRSITITFAVLPSATDVSQLPADDPALVISLQYTCGPILNGGTGNYYCGGSCSSSACHNACPAIKASAPNDLQCTCLIQPCQ